MNEKRRRAIRKIAAKLTDLKAELEDLQTDEQDAIDNTLESLQGGDVYQKSEEARDALGEAITALDEVIETHLDTAAA